jgi:hypothetical protein
VRTPPLVSPAPGAIHTLAHPCDVSPRVQPFCLLAHPAGSEPLFWCTNCPLPSRVRSSTNQFPPSSPSRPRPSLRCHPVITAEQGRHCFTFFFPLSLLQPNSILTFYLKHIVMSISLLDTIVQLNSPLQQ